ncbi:mitochondrial amidoxime-reducing component 1 [Plakobranchus ocellatus]|uniref:Mitochondrial amidoxime-reducing component 1 n=1 Tax=Plakobranchus ocellatus TaxID=259542 RepID=A0AAV4DTB0_9GAST|nr:mitochondrial amidoxime-reducing component 1 [Plakobranchus ocellatus]
MFPKWLGFSDRGPEVLTAVVLTSATKLAGLYLVAHRHRAKFQKIGTVASLYIYPVKSCGVLETIDAKVTNVGLEKDGLSDRQWMILDSRDETITMKEEARLSLIRCSSDAGNLLLHAPDMPVLTLSTRPDLSGAKLRPLKFLKKTIPVAECGVEAERWISDFLGRPARIVFSCPELGTRDCYTTKRKWDNHAKAGDVTIFSYLTSYLITTTSSLQHINSQLDTSVSMVNFRPNVVIDNSEPFDEDNWRELLIGDQTLFHVVEPCLRCVITTIEPDLAKRRQDKQPLKLLRSFRCRPPYGSSPLFGVYLANDYPGPVKVGDPVYVLKD